MNSPVLRASVEWHEARLGIPTASEFSRIVTPTGKLSAARATYMGELLAEWALGEPVGGFTGTEDTERGQVLEPEARTLLLRSSGTPSRGRSGSSTETTPTQTLSWSDAHLMRMVGDSGLLGTQVPAARQSPSLAGHGCPAGGSTSPRCRAALWVTGAGVAGTS